MKCELKTTAQIVAIVLMLVAIAAMSEIVIESNRNSKNYICEEE